MRINGLTRRDIELFRGDTLREYYGNPIADGVPLDDFEDWVFISVIHAFGDPSTVHETFEMIWDPDEQEWQRFLDSGPSAGLPTDVDLVEYVTKFTTPAGDVRTCDYGTIFLRGRA